MFLSNNTYITFKNLNIKICFSGSQEVNLIFPTYTDRLFLNNRIISSSFYFRFETSATLLLFCFATHPTWLGNKQKKSALLVQAVCNISKISWLLLLRNWIQLSKLTCDEPANIEDDGHRAQNDVATVVAPAQCQQDGYEYEKTHIDGDEGLPRTVGAVHQSYRAQE